jgi:hypothetical protein
MMIRSVRLLPSASTAGTLMLLGVIPGEDIPRYERVANDPETLLNSRSGRIHLFPAVADGEAVAFRHFQAQGGFLVSAARDAAGVGRVEIESRRDVDCRLMNPWPGRTVTVRDIAKRMAADAVMDTSNGECLIFPTKAGHSYLIEAKR